MSNQPPDSSNKKSIKDEIQRRKTEQIGRDVESRRNTQTTRPVSPSTPSSSASSPKVTAPKPASQPSRTPPSITPEPESSASRQLVYAGIGIIVVLVVLAIGFVAFNGTRTPPVPTVVVAAATSADQAVATQDAASGVSGPSVAGNVTLATLPPRTREPQTATPVDTLVPTKTPTVAGAAPASTATGNSSASGGNSVPLVVGPTITASGPIVQAEVSNSKAFNSAAPASVGRLSLDPKANISDVHGSTLTYTTDTGQQYTVVLWLTNSAQEAFDRYHVDAAGIDGAQPVQMGDEGVIGGPKSQILAEIRARNTVLIVYRPVPSSTVPSPPLTSDETLKLLTALYASIPH